MRDHAIVHHNLHRIVRGAVQLNDRSVSKLRNIAQREIRASQEDADRQLHAHQ